MALSMMITLGVATAVVVGLNGITWFMIIDEWAHDRKFSSLFGVFLITMFDLLIVAAFLQSRGQ